MKPGIMPALKHESDDVVQRATVENVRYNVARLERATPILKEMVAKKQLRVVGGVYDLATGKVSLV
jgi:carbonic anhydrase